MALKAIIPSGMTEITVNGLHQWDYGQQLEIHASDLPGLVEVHFACAGMNDAVVRPCDMVGGVGTVTIPDACLEQTAPIMAWVYEKDGAAGATVKTITLRVTPRARPTTSEAPPPEVIDEYTEAVTAMNEAVGRVADGHITAMKAINSTYALEADTATTAYKDLDGHVLSKAYYLSSVPTTDELKYFKNTDVNIDALCKPSQCGVYAIDWDTIKNRKKTDTDEGEYSITTLPDDIPDGAVKLIVEADYNNDTAPAVIQTLKMRTNEGEASARSLMWTRQYSSGFWSRWLRHVSAEELTEGTLIPAKAKNDDQGNPLDKKLNLGGATIYDVDIAQVPNGYGRPSLDSGTGEAILPGGGLVSLMIYSADYNHAINLIVDLAGVNVTHSSVFLMHRWIGDKAYLTRLKFTRQVSGDGKTTIYRVAREWASQDMENNLDWYPFEITQQPLDANSDYKLFVKYLAKY